MPKFVIDGQEYPVVERPTFKEAREIERVTGRPFGHLQDKDVQQEAGVMQAFIWLAMHRLDPSITYSHLDEMEITDVEQVDDEDEEVPPTEAPSTETSEASEVSG